jgi:hypothetical protein
MGLQFEHHHHLQGLSLLARSGFKNRAIFFTFLHHVFLSVGNIKVARELFLMASSVDVPANLSFFHVFFCLSSLFPVVTIVRRSVPCSIHHNLLHTVETACLLLTIFLLLFFWESLFDCHTPGMAGPWFYRILTAYISLFCLTLIKEYGMRVSENEVVRKIFGLET